MKIVQDIDAAAVQHSFHELLSVLRCGARTSQVNKINQRCYNNVELTLLTLLTLLSPSREKA